MKENRAFRGVWIPADIWNSKDITLQEKVFLVEIDSLDQGDKGCFAKNSHFEEFFGVSSRQCQRVIQSLVKKELITSEIVYDSEKKTKKRTLRIIKNQGDRSVTLQGDKNVANQGDKSVRFNNTLINNTSNTNVLEEKQKKSEISTEVQETPKQKAKQFFSSLEIQTQVAKNLANSKGLDVSKCYAEIQKFVLYWTEPNGTGKKQLWEMKKTFEVQRRLASWLLNSKLKPKEESEKAWHEKSAGVSI